MLNSKKICLDSCLPVLSYVILVAVFLGNASSLLAQSQVSSDMRFLVSTFRDANEDEVSNFENSVNELTLAPRSQVLTSRANPWDIPLRMKTVSDLSSPEPVSPEDVYSPWRLQDELADAGAPDWLRVSGQLRLRYEGIDGQFRTASRFDNSDHVLFIRTLLKVEADFDPVLITLELQDSRQIGGDRGSALNTASINAVELLQAFATVKFGQMGGGEHELRLGRQTFDLGARRLAARNRFRNAINAFTGAFWEWQSEDFKVSAFYTLPIERLPSDVPSVANNELEFDREDFDLEFFGVHLKHRVFKRHWLEAYFFGLLDDRKGGFNREIFTAGSRLILADQRGAFDYGIEAAYQFGDSQLATGGPDLDHSAGFAHMHFGYTFDTSWLPRVVIAFDFVSGDNDPNDGDNGRFDTLFGQPYEFGPTGLYTALNRFNLISPVVRFEVSPRSNLQLAWAWRPAWVASGRDVGTSARLQDLSGSSGSFIGHQFDFRLRWDVLPESIRVELGVVYLARGEFLREAPGAQGRDTLYQYLQVRWTF